MHVDSLDMNAYFRNLDFFFHLAMQALVIMILNIFTDWCSGPCLGTGTCLGTARSGPQGLCANMAGRPFSMPRWAYRGEGEAFSHRTSCLFYHKSPSPPLMHMSCTCVSMGSPPPCWDEFAEGKRKQFLMEQAIWSIEKCLLPLPRWQHGCVSLRRDNMGVPQICVP